MDQSRSPLHITSDGTGVGTHVTTADGVEIKGITGGSIWLDPIGVNTIDLEITQPCVEGDARVNRITFCCPVCAGAIEHQCPGATEPRTIGGN